METVTNATIAALGAAVDATTLPLYTPNLEPVDDVVTTSAAAGTCDIKNCFTRDSPKTHKKKSTF